MYKYKIFLSMLLCVSLVLSLGACNDKTTISEPESGSDKNSYRQEYVSDNKNTGFVDTDGDFEYNTVDFDGPKGYVIVYPGGNTNNKKSAEALAKYYKESLSVQLAVVSDSTVETDKEILIGKTSREQSDKTLKENELKVSMNGKKLVFDGGHDVTVNSAVEKFIRLAPENGKAVIFTLATDFVSTVLDGYKYVWGDEFEGMKLDRTKFSLQNHMTGTNSVLVSGDEDVVRVEDGRLKLFAIRYFDSERVGTQYKVPLSVSTINNMNFTYGYVEIRARLPFQYGAWPSFWSKSSQSPYLDTSSCDYSTEIDVFEIFGNFTDVEPNIHKWYKPENYDYAKIHGAVQNHTQFPKAEKTIFRFERSDTLSYEYHTYGMERTPTEISMFVDGKKYFTFDITKSFDLYSDMSGFKNYPIFLIFNNHIMTEDSDFITTEINNNELPTEFFIDYLRLYQKPGVGELYIDEAVKE